TAEAGGKICVIHPDNNKSAEENSIMYAELIEFSKGYDVKIATENMWSWDKDKDCVAFAACMTPESFCSHIDILNSEYITACLDIGHAEMRGANTSAVELIKALGPRLGALHIHDNDKWHDSHAIPFSMDIDFVPIVKALKEINYSGYFTLEADSYMKAYTKENALVGVMNLAAAARRLADMYEEF
ncbi:MAG: sugar phosphate isomerase/epimerase, partial [Ruminococcaceae bacterium]|nr:sugar phosphate isomerase/epimerase [Oscillospiraceae bacterium]